jgi:hypothetical protein
MAKATRVYSTPPTNMSVRRRELDRAGKAVRS